MSIGDVYRVAFEGVIQGNDAVTVHHFTVISNLGTTEDEPGALASLLAANAVTPYLAGLNSQFGIVNLRVRGVTQPQYGTDLGVAGQGGITGEISPFQIAALVLKRTGLIGRSRNGRTFIPAVSESSVQNGIIQNELALPVISFFDAIATISDVSFSFRHVVYSSLLLQAFPVVTVAVQPVAATMGRRKPGVGS